MTTFATEREARELNRILEESRLDYYGTRGDLISTEPNMNPGKNAIRDKEMDAVILRLGVEVERMKFGDADTIVLIGEPPRLKDQSLTSYAKTAVHFAAHHLVHSEKLRSIGSAKFDKLLSVDKQTRLQRIVRKILPDGKPPGIKYILDLRPPNEDEEAIILVTELSCTDGILNWHKNGDRFGVSPLMIHGKDTFDHLPLYGPVTQKNDSDDDEVQEPEKPSPVGVSSNSGPEDSSNEPKTKPKWPIEDPPRIGNWEGELPRPPSPIQTQSSDIITVPTSPKSFKTCPVNKKEDIDDIVDLPDLEYSPLRHRSAIERLIAAIEHRDPRLDSAPKVWNYFGIAKHFECATHERVNGWITKWIYAFPNSNFIQCNPEICYRIGLGINSYDLTRDAFSILVGEQALMRVHSNGQAIGQVSVYGRVREHMDDDEQNRVTHAADQLVSTIHATVAKILDLPDELLKDLSEFSIIYDFLPLNSYEEQVKQELLDAFKGYIRLRIIDVVRRNGQGNLQASDTYFNLTPLERVLTRHFWRMLNSEEFQDTHADTFMTQEHETVLSMFKIDADLKKPNPRGVLQEAIDEFNHMLIESHQAVLNRQSLLPANDGRSIQYELAGSTYKRPQASDLLSDLTSSEAKRRRTWVSDAEERGESETPTSWDLPIRPATSSRAFTANGLAATIAQTPVPHVEEHIDNKPAPRLQKLWVDTVEIYLLLKAVNKAIYRICAPILDPQHLWHNFDRLPTSQLDTLLCLGDEEWKYLPLWAGGNDDGTGGVFDETDVPNLEAGGFSAPGPRIHTGQTPAGSVTDGSDFSDLASDAQSTIGKASGNATDGTIVTASVKSINTLSENGDDMDPLWEMIRDSKGGNDDIESTIDGGDINSISGKGKQRADGKVFGISNDTSSKSNTTHDHHDHDLDFDLDLDLDEDDDDDDDDDDDNSTAKMSDDDLYGDDDDDDFDGFEKLDVADIKSQDGQLV